MREQPAPGPVAISDADPERPGRSECESVRDRLDFPDETGPGHRALGGWPEIAARPNTPRNNQCAADFSLSRRSGSRLSADAVPRRGAARGGECLERSRRGHECSPAARRRRPRCSGSTARLRRTFGYNQFEVIGQSRKALQNRRRKLAGHRANISRSTSMRAARRATATGSISQLLSGSAAPARTDATLSKSSPLVIKGPQIGAGQLLLLLRRAVARIRRRRARNCGARLAPALNALCVFSFPSFFSFSLLASVRTPNPNSISPARPGNCRKKFGRPNTRSGSRPISRS